MVHTIILIEQLNFNYAPLFLHMQKNGFLKTFCNLIVNSLFLDRGEPLSSLLIILFLNEFSNELGILNNTGKINHDIFDLFQKSFCFSQTTLFHVCRFRGTERNLRICPLCQMNID